MKKYDIIYTDPPWDYGGNKTCSGSNANNFYPTMTIKQLMNDIEVPAAENCLMFMWTSSPHMAEAIEVAKAWGFSYSTVGFVWDKQKPNVGYYTMSQVELCLIFKKGKIPLPRGSRGVRQFLSEAKREHSRKPAEIRRRIEEMFPTQTKLEMFARTSAPGWDVMGNETDKFDHESSLL